MRSENRSSMKKALDLAGELMKKAEDAGVQLLLPVDTVCAKGVQQ